MSSDFRTGHVPRASPAVTTRRRGRRGPTGRCRMRVVGTIPGLAIDCALTPRPAVFVGLVEMAVCRTANSFATYGLPSFFFGPVSAIAGLSPSGSTVSPLCLAVIEGNLGQDKGTVPSGLLPRRHRARSLVLRSEPDARPRLELGEGAPGHRLRIGLQVVVCRECTEPRAITRLGPRRAARAPRGWSTGCAASGRGAGRSGR